MDLNGSTRSQEGTNINMYGDLLRSIPIEESALESEVESLREEMTSQQGDQEDNKVRTSIKSETLESSQKLLHPYRMKTRKYPQRR